MKRTADVKGPAVGVTTAICTGAAILVSLALGPWTLPIALVGAIPMHRAAKSGFGYDLDQDVDGKADELAEEWARCRKPDENGIDIRYTTNTGGLFDLPVTRVYRYELEDHEKEPRTYMDSGPATCIPYIQYNPILPPSPSTPDWTTLRDIAFRQDD